MTDSRTDRWVLVAGGSGGIGRAISVALAEDGWNVALTYRSRAAAAEEAAAAVTAQGRDAVIFPLDLSSATDAGELVDRLGKTTPLSGVVYAAGPHIPMNFISQTTPASFANTIDQDLKAAYNLIQPSLDQLRANKGKVLAVVTPVIDRYTRMDILSSVPKAGVQALVRGVASEEGRYGVRANCIGVGMMEGEGMWNALIANGDFTEKGLEQLRRQTPLGHFGHVSDIAEAARFLMSDRARWVTGQTLHVDGGYSI